MMNLDILLAGRLRHVLVIRVEFLAAANAFVDAVFLPEPLKNNRTCKEMLSILTIDQKDIGKGLKKANVEKTRLAVPGAIAQVEGKYFNRYIWVEHDVIFSH